MLGFAYLRPPGTRLSGVEPPRARPGDTVILRGAGFAPEAAGNIVVFGDRTARVVSASESQLTIEVPELAVGAGQASSVGVRVVVGQSATPSLEMQVYSEAATPTAAAAPVASLPPVESVETTLAAEPTPPPAAGTRARATRPSAPRATPAPVAVAAAPPASEALPPAAAPPAIPPAQRRFVLDRTNVESTKRVTAQLEGFDT